MGIVNITESTVLADRGRAQALVIDGNAQNITSSATTARNATAFASDAVFLRIVADTAVYYKLGDSTVTAAVADTFLPAGVIDYIAISGNTHIAVIDK